MHDETFPLGCSAFCLRNESDMWIARNLDVPFSNGHILTNIRGISKQSIVGNDLSPAHWTSRWGSLTVNLLGVDCPMGGINECGLVIEHLWMPGTVYPDSRECDNLLEFEWIQFMLDTCTGVDDVRAQTEQVAILPGRVEMHFLLADGAGNCALLEFRGGQQLVYAGPSFQPSIVTNSWYDESVRYISSLQ
jgi:penicillin V acylase-like amidase (Ntn superfamily)